MEAVVKQGAFSYTGAMENIKSKQKIIILGILIIAALVGYYINRDAKNRITVPVPDTGIQATGDYTIEQIPLDPSLQGKQPNLDRPIAFGPEVTTEVKKMITENIADLVTKLKSDGTKVDDWISLGVQMKVAGDYEGAREAWEYAALLSPAYYVTFSNLGDLYTHYIKNYPKAEQNLKKAISLKTDYIAGYRSLYELYRYSYKEKADLAPQILKNGLAKNPKSTDLMVLLAQYYKETGDKTQALKYYNQALIKAEAQKNTALIDLLKQELQSLQ